MKKIYARFKDKGFEILGVTNDSRREDWLKALEQDQLPWKQVIDEFPEPTGQGDHDVCRTLFAYFDFDRA